MKAAAIPIRSELRPPYRSRTMMSRPLGSAPRKNLPSALSHCGPIGTPSSATTFTFSPSTVMVSER